MCIHMYMHVRMSAYIGKKNIPEIDKEQLELIKTAQKRIKQKKRLQHIVN